MVDIHFKKTSTDEYTYELCPVILLDGIEYRHRVFFQGKFLVVFSFLDFPESTFNRIGKKGWKIQVIKF